MSRSPPSILPSWTWFGQHLEPLGSRIFLFTKRWSLATGETDNSFDPSSSMHVFFLSFFLIWRLMKFWIWGSHNDSWMFLLCSLLGFVIFLWNIKVHLLRFIYSSLAKTMKYLSRYLAVSLFTCFRFLGFVLQLHKMQLKNLGPKPGILVNN